MSELDMRSGILVCFEDRAVICLTQRKADHKLCKIQHLFRLRKFVFTAEKQVCSIIDLKVADGHLF